MTAVLIVIAVAVGPPILVAVVAFGLSVTWPHRREEIGGILSGVTGLAYFALLAITFFTEADEQRDHLVAVQGLFLLPFLFVYLGFVWGGALAGEYTARKLRG
jgi:hypothetical protein